MHHLHKFCTNHLNSAGTSEVPDSVKGCESERLWVAVGFYFNTNKVSWLPHCNDVEPRVSAGERKEINVTPFSPAYANTLQGGGSLCKKGCYLLLPLHTWVHS